MILEAVIAAIGLGIAAQVLAERLRLPAILPLLLFGIVAGPSVLGLFDPEHLGEGLEALVHVGVALILFEGGLSLDTEQLRRLGGAIRNLLSLGAAITTLGSAGLAHGVLGMPWSTSLLFGAIVMVTGPTVVVPLLRHMVAPREVKVILTSEGLIIDAIGATVAYLVLQWVERTGMPVSLVVGEVLEVAGVGLVLGFAAGSLGRIVLKGRFVSGELRNLSILAILMLGFLAAESQTPQSGILMSVVMGVTMAAGRLPDLGRVKLFKGQLTILLISVLFVLLAAQLDLGAMLELGWRGAAVTAGLILLVRPLSVFCSVWPRQLCFRSRLALALTAPRGIVAAAVGSLAAISLRKQGIAGADSLEGLVYLVILVTGAWATLMAMALPRWLGWVDDPSRRCAVLVGAHKLTLLLARVAQRDGRSVVVVDGNPWRLDECRQLGYGTVVGDARDSSSYEEAGLERDSMLVAATPNDALNLLVAELAHNEFGIEHPVAALQRAPEELGTRSRAWLDLLGGREIGVGRWVRRLEGEEARVLDLAVSSATEPLLKELQQRWADEVLVVCGWREGAVTLGVKPEHIDELEALTIAVASARPLEFLSGHDEVSIRVWDEASPAGLGRGGAVPVEAATGSHPGASAARDPQP